MLDAVLEVVCFDNLKLILCQLSVEICYCVYFSASSKEIFGIALNRI